MNHCFYCKHVVARKDYLISDATADIRQLIKQGLSVCVPCQRFQFQSHINPVRTRPVVPPITVRLPDGCAADCPSPHRPAVELTIHSPTPTRDDCPASCQSPHREITFLDFNMPGSASFPTSIQSPIAPQQQYIQSPSPIIPQQEKLSGVVTVQLPCQLCDSPVQFYVGLQTGWMSHGEFCACQGPRIAAHETCAKFAVRKDIEKTMLEKAKVEQIFIQQHPGWPGLCPHLRKFGYDALVKGRTVYIGPESDFTAELKQKQYLA